jgi:guanylate kinase
LPKKIKGKRGLLVVISGPSGVGKSSVVARLLKTAPKLKLSTSATTRPPRPNEKDERDYFFMTEKEFFERERKHDFLEWAQVHGYYYGTPKSYIEDELSKKNMVVLEVDVQGASSIKEAVEKGRVKAAGTVFIFLIPPSVDILAFRLKKRKTEDEKIMNYRLRAAIAELQVMEKYDYIVVNDQIESAAEKIKAIINVEKERVLIN